MNYCLGTKGRTLVAALWYPCSHEARDHSHALRFFALYRLRQRPLERLASHWPVFDRYVLLPPPLVGQIDDQAWTRRGLSYREGIVQDGELLQAVSRLAESVAKGPV